MCTLLVLYYVSAFVEDFVLTLQRFAAFRNNTRITRLFTRQYIDWIPYFQPSFRTLKERGRRKLEEEEQAWKRRHEEDAKSNKEEEAMLLSRRKRNAEEFQKWEREHLMKRAQAQ